MLAGLKAGEAVVPGAAPTYICCHDSAPPSHQNIRSDPENLLIRALTRKRKREREAARGAGKSKEAGAGGGGRPATRRGGKRAWQGD